MCMCSCIHDKVGTIHRYIHTYMKMWAQFYALYFITRKKQVNTYMRMRKLSQSGKIVWSLIYIHIQRYIHTYIGEDEHNLIQYKYLNTYMHTHMLQQKGKMCIHTCIHTYIYRQEEIATLQQGGRKIRFKKGELIGAGSFGQVFLGLNEATGTYIIYIYIYIYIYICINMYVYMCVYIHVHSHVCVRACL
jgi:hypothetical protein